jgi:di/tricarboxylate transporter
MALIEPSFHMWVTFAVIGAALVLYAWERTPMEVTSVGVICVLFLFFHFFPIPGADGVNRLDARRILLGFANPALIAVVALLVMGQGMVRTGVLDRAARSRVWVWAAAAPGCPWPLPWRRFWW